MNAVVHPVLILFYQVTQRTTGSDMGHKFQRALLIANFCSHFSSFPACFHRLINARTYKCTYKSPIYSAAMPQDGSEASWESSTRIELKAEFPGAAVRSPVPAPASCSPSSSSHSQIMQLKPFIVLILVSDRHRNASVTP